MESMVNSNLYGYLMLAVFSIFLVIIGFGYQQTVKNGADWVENRETLCQ